MCVSKEEEKCVTKGKLFHLNIDILQGDIDLVGDGGGGIYREILPTQERTRSYYDYTIGGHGI